MRYTLFIILFTVLILPSICSAQTYSEKLIEKAVNERIYDEREWDVLLHYKDTILRTKHSLIDDENFFLSADGKYSPQSEVEATIRGFFDTSSYADSNDHPLCRYPARFQWLQQRLDIDITKLPKLECAQFNEAYKRIDPQSITLVFPFLYINRPMSMFGHTLLRINNSYNDPLLAHGVTFAAVKPKDVNMIIYSVKGLFGAYPGQFTVRPYYKTIFAYSNIDMRDIWEYDLNFTTEESRRLFYHLWELSDIYSDYFFFDENCSYNLLFLLEAARPSLKLTTSIIWEAPSDTVKAVNDLSLVTKVTYRPSHSKVIENIASILPKKAINEAKDASKGYLSLSAITEGDYPNGIKVVALDLAIEMLRYDSIAKEPTVTNLKFYKDKTIELLSARSKFHTKSSYPLKTPAAPHLGHDVSRVYGTVGFDDDAFYTELGFAFSFHSLTDIDDGYVENTEAMFGDMLLRYNTKTGDIILKKFTLGSIGAYIPMTKLFKPLSWRIKTGVINKHLDDGRYLVPYVNGGAGVTFKMFDSVNVWLLADIDLSLSKGYKSFVGLGLGGYGGVSTSFKYGKVILDGYYRNYILSGFGEEAAATLSYTFPVTRNNAIKAAYKRELSWGDHSSDISLSWTFYF